MGYINRYIVRFQVECNHKLFDYCFYYGWCCSSWFFLFILLETDKVATCWLFNHVDAAMDLCMRVNKLFELHCFRYSLVVLTSVIKFTISLLFNQLALPFLRTTSAQTERGILTPGQPSFSIYVPRLAPWRGHSSLYIQRMYDLQDRPNFYQGIVRRYREFHNVCKCNRPLKNAGPYRVSNPGPSAHEVSTLPRHYKS